ncbi:MAG: biotin--[acetyl-CoA-carboxylase] ligase [Caldimicrobium sp.]
MKLPQNTPLEEKILKTLKRSTDLVSGERLSRLFGVSRVAIWKAIKKLQEKGYPIKVYKRGYALENKDIFLKEELENLIKKSIFFEEVFYFLSTTSTMDIAKELAEKEKKAIVIAERQSKGRGRLGRVWESELGGLWFTLILRYPIPLKEVFLLTYLSAVSAALAINKTYNLEAKVKWPNDVLLLEKKVAGILLEIKAEVDLLLYALIGIGVNVNNEVSSKDFLYPAISISEVLNQKVSRLPLLENFLQYFEELLLNKDQILPIWRTLSDTLGKKVKVLSSERVFIGKAIDVDNEGALLLQSEEGKIERIFSGDCFHLRNLAL